MSKIRFHHTYNNIISLENLLEAWKEFVRGKRTRKDVQEFERDLMTNLIALHRELAAKKSTPKFPLGSTRQRNFQISPISSAKIKKGSRRTTVRL